MYELLSLHAAVKTVFNGLHSPFRPSIERQHHFLLFYWLCLFIIIKHFHFNLIGSSWGMQLSHHLHLLLLKLSLCPICKLQIFLQIHDLAHLRLNSSAFPLDFPSMIILPFFPLLIFTQCWVISGSHDLCWFSPHKLRLLQHSLTLLYKSIKPLHALLSRLQVLNLCHLLIS